MALNLKKATRYNRITANTVGWGSKSGQVFDLLGFHSTSPTEEAFARAVEGWQRAHGITADGMLGPATWKLMEPLTNKPPKASPLPTVDWFKVAPKGPPTRGKLLVSEGDVTAGALVVNDAYDLSLYEMSDGNYELALFMKVQFSKNMESNSQRRESKLRLALALCAALCSAACERRGDMTRCMEQWRKLVEQQQSADEQKHAQTFAECARKNKLVYTLSLTDRASGSELPIAQLGAHHGPVSVSVTVELDGRQEVLRWEPQSAESVYPLLME